MRTRSLVPWLLVASFAVAGLGVGSVFAENDPTWPPPETCKPTKSESDAAHKLFEVGKTYYQTSAYGEAIKYWKDAYRKDCTGALLLKYIGSAYEADGQWAAAVETLKLYRVRGKPTGDELDQLDQKIANLSKKAGSSPTTTTSDTTSTTAATTTTTSATGPATTTAPTTTSSTAPTTTTTATTTATVPPAGGGRSSVPLYVAIGGGVLAVGGGVLWLVENGAVSSKSDDFNKLKCGTGPAKDQVGTCNTLASDGSSAKNLRTVGIIVAGVGVVAAGVGLGLYLAGGSDHKDSASLLLTPGPGLAGLGLSGRF